MTEHHILVVDDDPGIQEILGDYLQESGYRVSITGDVAGMRRVLDQDKVDLVLLDLGLPDQDGLSAARDLRAVSEHIAIIIITGRDEQVDRIVGLEVGADDYVTKPFHLRELLARIRTVMRRSGGAVSEVEKASKNIASFNDWQLDVKSRALTGPDDASIELGAIEFQILLLFLHQTHEVHNRVDLLQKIYNREWQPFDRAIDVQVARLRKKFDDAGMPADLVKTVRGEGYLFTADVTWS